MARSRIPAAELLSIPSAYVRIARLSEPEPITSAYPAKYAYWSVDAGRQPESECQSQWIATDTSTPASRSDVAAVTDDESRFRPFQPSKFAFMLSWDWLMLAVRITEYRCTVPAVPGRDAISFIPLAATCRVRTSTEPWRAGYGDVPAKSRTAELLPKLGWSV